MDLSKEELVDKILFLQKELEKYQNSNTPSSSNKHMKPDTSGKQNKKNSKRGAPFGHVGKTRQQIPARKEIVDANECPKCHGHNIVDDKIIMIQLHVWD